MSEHPDPDAELLNELRTVLGRVEPVPAEVTEFAEAALGWRRLDADLAELLADSALETGVGLARSEDTARRWLTFRTADLAIDIEVGAQDDTRTLLGQLAPPLAAVTIEVQAADGTVTASTETDALGRFRLELAAGGRARLRVLRHDPPGTPIETSWVLL